MIILTFFVGSFCTRSLPKPSLPPVITTSSFSQFHLSLVQLLRAPRFKKLLREAEVKADRQAAQSGRVLQGKLLALAGTACKKEGRECQGRIEDCVLDDTIDEVGCKV